MATINLTTEDFKNKVFDYTSNEEWNYSGDKPCIIDFYANWCGPCKTLSPILDSLSDEYENVIFYKVNTEDEQELSQVFGIRSIPTMLFVPMSDKPQMTQGALPKSDIVKVINDILL